MGAYSDLELEIFHALTEHEIETLGDQKDLCRRIFQLFPPHDLTKYALRAIIAQLKACKFKCKAGSLELNTAFIALCELSETS